MRKQTTERNYSVRLRHPAAAGTRFIHCTEGTTATLFTLTLLPVMFMIGAGFDISNAVRTRSNLQQVVDATVLAVTRQVEAGLKDGALTTYATNYVNATGYQIGATLAASNPVINSVTGEVCVTANANMNTAVMKIAAISTLSLTAKACAQAKASSYEIALVLDTTGSMGNKDNKGQTKLKSMQNAANTFIDTMFDSATLGPNTKMSVVPFAPSVNVGTTYANATWMDTSAQSSWHWKSPMFAPNNAIATDRFALFTLLQNQKSSWAWGGCVESPPYPYNISDDGPTSANPDTLILPMLAPDEPADVEETVTTGSGWKKTTKTITVAEYNNSYIGDTGSCSTAAPTDNSTASQTTAQSRLCKYKNATSKSSSNGPNRYCTSKPLVRLQTTKTSLKNTINSLTDSGSTNVHEGFMWGWRTISPNAPFSDGAAYTSATTVKVIVLMTDGENTWYEADNALNGSDYSAYGYFKSASGRMPKDENNNEMVPTDGSSARAAMDELLRQSCDAAKAKGIKIYTIAFSVNSDPMDDQAKNLLKYCASEESNYFAPNSQQTLSEAFTSITTSLGDLRLSK